MAKDTSKLHPKLQEKMEQLLDLCKKEGIPIGISECVRTVKEQDIFYAKGRTTSGKIVTNCRGVDYASMHQWGVAFDFYLKVDVDKDGKIADDAFNNTTRLFNKVGAIGKKVGLEWGGDFKSIIDLPHFQLPDWGSTAGRLKAAYKTPEAFFKTWKKTTSKKKTEKPANTKTTCSKSSSVVEPAKGKNVAKYNNTYIVNTSSGGLNLRTAPGTKSGIITTIPKGTKVNCFGFYTKKDKIDWLFVSYGKYTGYLSSVYLKKVQQSKKK